MVPDATGLNNQIDSNSMAKSTCKSMQDVRELLESEGSSGDEETVKKLQKSFAQINAVYVGRAEHLFTLMLSLADLYDNIPELASMNFQKRGAPFKYTNGLIFAIATLRSAFALDYRTCEGMARVFLRRTGGDAPCYTQIWRRVNSLDISIKDGLAEPELDGMSITLIPDGTGLTPAERSEYIRVVHKLRRGFLRLVIVINRKTQEIVSHSLTDEKTGEPTVFEDIIEQSLVNIGIDPDERRRQVRAERRKKRKTYRPLRIIADGGFDTRKIFSFCRALDITPDIRVQTNSNARADGVDRARSEVVLEQLGGSKNTTPAELAAMTEAEREENRKKWKKTVEYGTRWIVEIVISAFKRTYGGAVMSKKMEYIRQEIRQKICVYNKMLRVGQEASMNV